MNFLANHCVWHRENAGLLTVREMQGEATWAIAEHEGEGFS